MRTSVLVTILGMLACPVTVCADRILIDDFLPGPDWTLNASGSKTDLDAGPPYLHILGGQRDSTLAVADGSPTLQHDVLSPDRADDGVMHYRAHGGHATWSLEYSGTGGQLNADLLEESREVFVVGFWYKSIPDAVPMTVTVTSGKGTSDEATDSVTVDVVGTVGPDPVPEPHPHGTAMGVEVLYKDFTGIDFTDVDVVKFAFDCTGSTPDLVLEGVVNCPEPCTMGLLALGGLALLRRKRGYGG